MKSWNKLVKLTYGLRADLITSIKGRNVLNELIQRARELMYRDDEPFIPGQMVLVFDSIEKVFTE